MSNNLILHKLSVVLIALLFVLSLNVIVVLAIHSFKEKGVYNTKIHDNLVTRVDSLEKRIVTFENLYRDHLENCSFISNEQIRVGHNNYLQLIEEDGTIRN